MKLLWQCMFSPRLYKIYREGTGDTLYQPQGWEKWGDKVISSANTIMNIGLYTSPFIGMYLLKRGLFTVEESLQLGRFFTGLGCLLVVSLVLRAYGRARNPKYMEFLTALNSPRNDKDEYLHGIRKYDFEFKYWPVTFSVPPYPNPALEQNPFTTTANEDLPVYKRRIIQILGFIATHTFGLRLVYPGSMALIQNMLWMPLFQGRTVLVEVYDGLRTKLQACDGNTIDTMFVDRRDYSERGNILVVCCEGNSGFYEFGIMTTPIKAGYSSLGWNHPGFAGSTGTPFPRQERNAIEAVMDYAIEELGFEPEYIVMFGWSIGGYPATYAAMKYPVRALILDATFDDLLPLAENQMPSSWSLLVKEVVRSYVNLDITAMLEVYNGPVQLVRRTEDEIISLRPGHLWSNRGNFLVTDLIATRHPEVLEDPMATAAMHKLVALLQTQRAALEHGVMDFNDRAILPLVNRYMRDFKSTHCTPMPEDMFVSVIEELMRRRPGTPLLNRRIH
ncbi:phosphatidylserine lipase ABHD16A [Anticarsia gemmatalis]|uniref:phosphatidylserine lipase ABHD16A n=1 Tax=Anticarsia gemmatalis TaxID=129554 RepID=UPI003F759D6D